MKAQGLPINFIVIAALAILILILAAGFVVAGGSSFTGAIGPEAMRNKCQSYCNTLNMYTMNNIVTAPTKKRPFSGAPTDYCSKSFAIKGVGTGSCGSLSSSLGTSCYVTFEDGTSCKVSCGRSNNPTCS